MVVKRLRLQTPWPLPMRYSNRSSAIQSAPLSNTSDHIASPISYRNRFSVWFKALRHSSPNVISQGLHRCDITITHRNSTFPIYIWPPAPSSMWYCDFVAVVGSAFALSNGPHIFSTTVIAPTCKVMFFPFKMVFSHLKGKRAISSYLHYLPARSKSKGTNIHSWAIFGLVLQLESSRQLAYGLNKLLVNKSSSIMQFPSFLMIFWSVCVETFLKPAKVHLVVLFCQSSVKARTIY